MRKPLPHERVRCPNSHNQKKEWAPKEVWDTKGPDGESQSFGTLDKHFHRYDWTKECDNTGLPFPVIKRSKTAEDPEKNDRPTTSTTPTGGLPYGIFGDVECKDDKFVEEFWEKHADLFLTSAYWMWID
jgi:hypothetical protein